MVGVNRMLMLCTHAQINRKFNIDWRWKGIEKEGFIKSSLSFLCFVLSTAQLSSVGIWWGFILLPMSTSATACFCYFVLNVYIVVTLVVFERRTHFDDSIFTNLSNVIVRSSFLLRFFVLFFDLTLSIFKVTLVIE